MVCSPVLLETNNHLNISQQNDNYVWSLLFELLEKRMKNGDFTIIDATHSKSSDFSRYNSLCETYRYRKYIISFTDIPKEVCLERNHNRDIYKRVPDEVIEKMYSRFATQQKTSGWVNVPRDKFWEIFSNKIYDFNNYRKIHIFGDIHGCYNPLMEYIIKSSDLIKKDKYYDPEELSKLLNEEDFYLFTGDYIDRGLQNKEVIEFLYLIHKNKNVLLLEGNHEIYMQLYATDQDDKISSKEFLNNTKPQLKGIDYKVLKSIYKKLGQMAYFNYKDHNYLITHGGLNIVPEIIQFIPTNQLIKGVGKFQYPIDDVFTNNTNGDTIQIHGHRFIESEKENLYSYSLEDRVEFGGNLKIAELSNEGLKFYSIKNDLFKNNQLQEHKLLEKEELTADNLVKKLRENPNVRESELGNNISSFNFTSKAFREKSWDSETVKSRGLFIDTKNNKIVARGYEKFFNINERELTKLFNLKSLFNNDNEVVAYKKYNGFLGILSYYNDNLQFHSKSSNCGDYANYFRNLFTSKLDAVQISMIEQYLKTHDTSLVFEVIDIENDPHIIEESKNRIVLLDMIKNTLDFSKEPYDTLVSFAKSINLSENQYKQIYTKFSSFRELVEFYEEHKDETNMKDIDIEGVVIESGQFMTKLKFNYYNFWKYMRTLSERILKGGIIRTGSLLNPLANYFYKFLKDKYDYRKDILEQINNKANLDIKIKDLSKLKLEGNYLISNEIDRTLLGKIKTMIKRHLAHNNSIFIYRTKEIDLGDDLSQKLQQILDEKTDIISLRKEFYNNYYKGENNENTRKDN